MIEQMRTAFEAFLSMSAPDDYDASNPDALHIWQTATLAERERCALVCAGGCISKKNPLQPVKARGVKMHLASALGQLRETI